MDEGLHQTLLYLRDFIPVDHAFLNYYDIGIGAYITIAKASVDCGEAVHLIAAMPDEARKKIRIRITEYKSGSVVIDSAKTNPAAAAMVRFHSIEGSSILRMTLMTNDGKLSSVVLTAKGLDRYTKEHASLFAHLVKPFTIAMSNALKHREVISLKDMLVEDNKYLHHELRRLSGDEIIGANFGLKAVTELARRVAVIDSPVLLLGETGTGKDVIANAIHFSSSRQNGPIVKVNCGAIPHNLIDSELFRHEKGSFTGAINKKRGCFERADKGTIFLDEIGELPLQAQVRLLRVLQDKEIQRVGGDKTLTLDVRVIAATNRDLERMVKDGSFREDLWYRLNVFPIHIPPLRDRKSDIPALVQYFVEKKAAELKLPGIPKIVPNASEALIRYDWPGNVRELANIIERALILNPQGPISFENLGSTQPHAVVPDIQTKSPTHSLDEVISNHTRRVISETGGKIYGKHGAAELLEVNPNTLRSRMKKLGIDGTQ
jgi:transcriptional regulator with GAF, ATPase, and Fis domain